MWKRNKVFSVIMVCLVLAGCKKSGDPLPEEEEPKDTTPKEYQLVWSDEFDGTALDMTKWSYTTGTGFGNQEKQYCTERVQNVRVEGGNLVIAALKETYTPPGPAATEYNYTSGRINSKGKGFVKYGKVEARISLPSGRGTWPAFWMLPETGSWPLYGEIDIMEHVGSEPTMISHALHTNNRNGSRGNNWHNRQYPGNVEGEFHVYTMEWLEDFDKGDDCMIFYINGKESARVYQNSEDIKDWPFNRDFYVILNLAIGGTWGGTIDDAIFNNPVEMKVDYIRMYQKK
jgi:beta-glucanase (GH16 family)